MHPVSLVIARWRGHLARYLDLGLGLLLLGIAAATALTVPSALGTMPPLLAAALATVTSLAISVRRRWPIPVLLAVAGAVFVEQLYGASLNFGSLGLVIAVFTVAVESPRRTSLLVLAAMPLYLLGALLAFDAIHPVSRDLVLAQYLSAVVIFGVSWFAGESVRARRVRIVDLEARADRLEREQAERARIAVQNERALIARELHDIVAHSVSVMVVQAGAARTILDEQPDQARAALASIETTGREALSEMRRLLGILRTDDSPVPLEPQRGLAGLGSVIAGADRGGVTVELVIEGEPRPLPPGLDLTAYRIVQEALTNTMKHAAPARAVVRIAFEPDTLHLDISDDGRHRPDPTDSRGHGLIGMEERVRLYGGDFQAGPRDPAGFTVKARIPIGAAAG